MYTLTSSGRKHGFVLVAFLLITLGWRVLLSVDTESKVLDTALDPEVYEVIVNKATEPPFSSPMHTEKRPGTYVAADTGKPVFRSEQKFDSGTGWPSFTAPVTPDAIRLADDRGLLGKRTEVLSTAGGHLGHVFDDGPAPTGKRYCINGLALRFIPDNPEDARLFKIR